MAVSTDFAPRLMPAPRAAHYLGVSESVFAYLRLPSKYINTIRLFDRYSLDTVDADDITDAKERLEIERLFDAGEFTIQNGDKKRHSIPAKIRSKIFERDGFCCAYCGDTNGPFHLDHIYPVSRGGTNAVENLTVACAFCNFSKRDKTLEEWGGRKRRPAENFFAISDTNISLEE